LKNGIHVTDSGHLTIGQNVIRDCLGGLFLRDVSSTTIQGNSLQNCREGLTIEQGSGMAINGNQVDEAETPVRLLGLKQTSITGNVFSGKQKASIGGEIQQIHVQGNLGLPDNSALDNGNGAK
jgi:parallel beta-helix repeat protein